MFSTVSFQSWALCFLFSISLSGIIDKTVALDMHIREEGEVTLQGKSSIEAQQGLTFTDSSRQLPSVQAKRQSKEPKMGSPALSSSARLPSFKRFTCKGSDVVENVIIPRDYSRMRSMESSSSSSENLEKPAFRRVQSGGPGGTTGGKSVASFLDASSPGTAPETSQGGKMGRHILSNKAELVSQKRHFWPYLRFVEPKKTFDSESSSVVLEEVDPEAFTHYIWGQQKKTRPYQMSNLKKLTEANKKTCPNQFQNMIQSLEPVLQIKSMRYMDSPINDGKISHDPQRYVDGFIDDGRMPISPQPALKKIDKIKIQTKKTILNVLKEHLKNNQDFSKPSRNLWMFYRTLKDQLHEEEEKGKSVYDLPSLEKVANKIFKEGGQRKVSHMTDTKVLEEIVNENIDSILSARLESSVRHQNLTEEDALYVRQCLGSVHTFTMKYKSSTAEPLLRAITTYYATIHQRYWEFPELRYLAYRLHQEYNSKLLGHDKHAINDIDPAK
ncbi:uncharacterized protein MELLADRAFT_59631 [Melampsora larici-populina 98AG31]|uniref:Secreted protein n=1 Tax=Melampsora larici-populina (strain 98AG31 / pathotype 3-4-7) TaxID=747676 RepID=F4R884_MELLP|nr:uncharacterized protein MELLADRAFT_59631 [Melampsora larici-populina 98AG31]EGG11449.1 hypothetical protein MELLADRAFT_59631 [Melampsora larici-populina 98AG31]